MSSRWLPSVVAVGSLFSSASFLAAQPPAADAPPAAKPTATATASPTATATPTATGPKLPGAPAAETKPAEPAPSPEMQAYGDLKRQWTEIREQLHHLQIDYKNAKPDERKPIADKFAQVHADGEQFQAKLLKAAEAVLKTDPKNKEIGDFLAAFASGLYNADRYDEALPLAEALVRADYPNKRIFNLAGKAAFNLCEFDKAEGYLKTAQAASALDLRGERYLAEVPAYKTLWKKEQELRAAETKADDLPRVSLRTTAGEIVLELFENEAPQTVGNFIHLVEKGFYNGLAFHRVIAEFMAQGGDPNGDGTGGPGYEIYCECYKPEKRNHFRGSLSMAHRGKDTGGSQFFITFLPTANLDGPAVDPKNTGASHTVFGRVVTGLDVLAKLTRRQPPDFHSSSKEPPLPADRIVEAKVLRKRNHPYEPTKVKPPEPAKPAEPETKTTPATKEPEAKTPPAAKEPESKKEPEAKPSSDTKIPDEKKPE